MVPPNILLNNWESDWFNERENVDVLLIQAYQAGADAELEECCKWLGKRSGWEYVTGQLSAARRPKPLSLKEEALRAISQLENGAIAVGERADTIRRALEQLPDQASEEL